MEGPDPVFLRFQLLMLWKSKLSLSEDTSLLEESSRPRLKLGLFSYPVLQAADILVHRLERPVLITTQSLMDYRATHVPVGEDQSQHLEFARECVTNFNHAYGPRLVAPQTIMCTLWDLGGGKLLTFHSFG